MTENLTNTYPQTKIVGKRLEEYRQATEDMLGKSKFWGTLSEKIEPEHTFGKKSQLGDVWNAGRCINGDKTTVKKNHYNQIQIKEEMSTMLRN